jgi:uncharacterized membrane protein YccC
MHACASGVHRATMVHMLQVIRQLTWRHALFSAKTFLAAMLALYIAFRLNLSQPSWCVTTVYIVSQPLAGMVLAKSLYRVLGTLIGAVMSLVFVALFSNTPELFCLVLALWIGAGTSVSIYLRDAPQAYVGMLAGYSAAIIGLPAALEPHIAFDFAVARCLEIMLGIACGTLVHHVVFPQRAGDALRKAIGAVLPSMARWAGDALRGQEGEAKGLIDRRQIISAVVSLDTMRVFASLDTPAIRAIDAVVRQFEGRLLSLLALLVSVYDRFAILQRTRPMVADDIRPLLESAAAHITESADAATPAQSRGESGQEALLVRNIDARLPPPQALRSDPDSFLVRSILLRLRDVVTMWQEAVFLRTHIRAGTHLPDGGGAPAFHPYRDVMFALIGGAISAITVLIASAFWIFTAWPNGAAAVTFAGIMCAIMGGRDDPASAAIVFLKMLIVSTVFAGIYLFLVLPPLTTFPALVVALAPFFLVCGLFLAIPATIPYALPIVMNASVLIGVSNAMTYDFAVFANNFAGYVVGIWIGAAALRLLRPLSTEWAVQRLTRGIMADLARMADAPLTEPRSAFESRMFDRINALLMRLDPMIAPQRLAMQGGLASLRVGLNILALRGYRPLLPQAAVLPVERALRVLADHFLRAAQSKEARSPLAVLRAVRGRLLSLEESPLLTTVIEGLYSIEMTLAQHPDFFGLPTDPSIASAAQPVTA